MTSLYMLILKKQIFTKEFKERYAIMEVRLIDSMGTDLTVVNAARVSFNKHVSEWKDTEERLIKFIAEHGHWTPFGHPQLQFRISAISLPKISESDIKSLIQESET